MKLKFKQVRQIHELWDEVIDDEANKIYYNLYDIFILSKIIYLFFSKSQLLNVLESPLGVIQLVIHFVMFNHAAKMVSVYFYVSDISPGFEHLLFSIRVKSKKFHIWFLSLSMSHHLLVVLLILTLSLLVVILNYLLLILQWNILFDHYIFSSIIDLCINCNISTSLTVLGVEFTVSCMEPIHQFYLYSLNLIIVLLN